MDVSKTETIPVVPKRYCTELLKQVFELSGVPKYWSTISTTGDGSQNLRIIFLNPLALDITFRFDHNAKQYMVVEKNGEPIPPILFTEEPIRSLLIAQGQIWAAVTTKNKN